MIGLLLLISTVHSCKYSTHCTFFETRDSQIFSLTIYVYIGTWEPVVESDTDSIPWDPDSQDIMIRTDSALGGGNPLIRVDFLNYANTLGGRVMVEFTPTPSYEIGGNCIGNKQFPVSLPTEINKIWRISFSHEDLRMRIVCNDVEVVNVVLSDSFCDDLADKSVWRSNWETEKSKPAKFKFAVNYNTASDEYCLRG